MSATRYYKGIPLSQFKVIVHEVLLCFQRRKKSPYVEADFYELVQQGVIDKATYVWFHGLKQWSPFGDVREIYLGQVRLPQSDSSGLTQPAFAFKQQASFNNLSFAGCWICVAATLIDSWMLFGMNLGVALLFGFSVFTGSAMEPVSTHGGGTAILAQIFQALLPLLYSVYFVGKYGATPGKKAVGIKIIREDGSPVGYGLALGRLFAKIISALIFYIGNIYDSLYLPKMWPARLYLPYTGH